MPKNIAGLRKIGRAFVKKRFDGTFTGDGVEHPMAAILLPPYMWPNRQWVSYRCVSTANDTNPISQAELVISGRAGNIITWIDKDSFEGEGEIRDMFEAYLPFDQDWNSSSASVTATDVGISGGELSRKDKNEWLRKDINLGLPNNAVLTGSHAIRYAAQYYSGQEYLIPGRDVSFKAPQLYGIGATYQTPITSSSDADIEKTMMAGQTYSDDMYRSIVEALPVPAGDTADPLITDGTNELSADIQHWLSQGFSLSKDGDAYAEPTMAYSVKWTMEVMIGAPQDSNTLYGA